jgi:hypothetical protein
MPRTSALRAALLAAALGLVAAPAAQAQSLPPEPSTDPVINWYDATRVAVDQAGYPAAGNTQITASRTWAIAWGAADDAIRALPATLTPAGRDAATQAALATAVHDALAGSLPAAKSLVDEARRRTLARIPGSRAKELGKAAGRKAAAAWLAARSHDGLDVSAVNAPFTPPADPAPGVWRPTPPAYGGAVQYGQGQARPFLIPDVATRFVAPPPPAIDSPTVIADLEEIDRLGSATSIERTDAQTAMARFWSQTSVNGFTQVLRGTITGADRPIAPRVHLVAVFHQVTADAQIAIYASKYRYLRWRPVTALTIDDGNPATPFDPAFRPWLNTPSHPEYPSGHTGYAGAAEAVFRALVGPRPASPITISSSASPTVFHTYDDWAQPTQENVDARVWEGIHLRSTDVASVAFGKQIAAAALKAVTRASGARTGAP